MEILQAIRERQCIRAYLDKPVAPQLVHELLEHARWAPSGVNTQPWQVAVVKGESKRRIGEAIIAARQQNQDENPDYRYYPDKWQAPFRQRRKECGLALYQALGIGREDKDKRLQAWYRNYHFFHAPVGLLFFIPQDLQTGSWLDMGMFLQNIMLAARHFGLDTCPQASLAEYPDIVREILQLPAEQRLICGMALGYADQTAAVNQYRLPREEPDAFTLWYD